jgi:hypothetical protein
VFGRGGGEREQTWWSIVRVLLSTEVDWLFYPLLRSPSRRRLQRRAKLQIGG